MKSINLLVICLMSWVHIIAQNNVGIGTTAPATSAQLEVRSTNKGFLMPRMTTAQRDSIVSPVVGLQIFNLDDQCTDLYDGANWIKNCGLKVVGTATDPDHPTPNSWVQKANFGGTGRSGAVGFSIGSKGYIGTGDSETGYKNDFWEYDPSANIWTQKGNFEGSARFGAVGFNIGSKGFIGTGFDTYGLKKDFWEYDPSINVWTPKAPFAGTPRYMATGFSIGSKGYIGTGLDSDLDFKNDFWEYDPSTDIWTKKENFRGTPRLGAVGFSIGSKGYIGTGLGSDLDYKNDFWEYDPSTEVWREKTNFGGTTRNGAVGFSIGSKGYIGTGSVYGYLTDFWEYMDNNVTGTAYSSNSLSSTGNSITDGAWTLANGVVYNANNGNVGIGTSSPSSKLDVTGSIKASTTLTAGGLNTAGIVTNSTAGLLGTTSTVGVTNGGTGTSSAFTTGSITFAGASGIYAQNNANLFWDNANARLGIGINTPTQKLEVAGTTKTTKLQVTSGAANGAVLTSDANGNANWENKIKTNELQVGAGTAMNGIQLGTFNAGANPSAFKIVTITFPVAFTAPPKVFASARNEATFNDTFSVTVRTVTATSVTLNIQRVDLAGAWAQNLQIDWMAVL